MPSLSFDDAWRDYRRAEPRLPPKPEPVVPRRIPGVMAVAEHFDLVVLDAWGVLNIADEPIATARESVAALRRRGTRLLVLSNDGSRRGEEAAARHRRRGFDFAAAEIIAGIDLLPELLRRFGPAEGIGLIADPPAPLADLTRAMLPLGEDGAAYDRADAFLFLSSDRWTERRQARLQASLAARPRPLIIGNPDIVSPAPEGMVAEPGFYAHRLAAATGVEPVFCGKPFAPIYERVAARFPDVPPDRVLCVGDTLHTDILGARAAGYRSLLVEDGFCRGRDALALAADCGIWPDFVAPRL